MDDMNLNEANLRQPSGELILLVAENLPSEYENAHSDDRAIVRLLNVVADYLIKNQN